MQTLRLITFDDANLALGVAIRLTTRHPVFARQPFGEWADMLAAQAQRRHQVFVIDGSREIRGFFGYALVTRSAAEAWASGNRQLTNAECAAGDCVILNVWVSSGQPVLRFMVDALRRLCLHKESLYFKRFYASGAMRVARLDQNDFVARHVARQKSFVDELPTEREENWIL